MDHKEHWEKCLNILFEINKLSESRRLARYLDKKSFPGWFQNKYYNDLGFSDLDKLLKTVPRDI